MRLPSFKDQTALKGILAGITSLAAVFGPDNNIGAVTTSNVTTKFRESFETYTPGQYWTESKQGGDLIFLDGNSVGASYLVISKDPFGLGTETSLTSVVNFNMPIEASMGVSLSQRTSGQEIAFELVDVGYKTEDVIPTIPEIAISSISQATTTLTVTTATAHGLKVGQRIGIYGCSDSRMNYPVLVVASIVSATQFTVTAGPFGGLPSVTAGPFTTGYVYPRPALGYAKSGTSMIFESTTATTASVYVCSDDGDALPSGTPAGNHAVTVGTTASVLPVTSPYTYAFQPTTEFKIAMQADRVQFSDTGVDSTGQTSARFTKTQVIPNNTKTYAMRARVVNRKGATVPVAKIVSAVKTGTTTATVTTDVAHGLTTGHLVNLYGVRDQTNFVNLNSAAAVASIVNSTTFTCVWGAAVTATSYGGTVYRMNGGLAASTMGAVANSASTITVTGGIVTLVGGATFASLLNIGDTINLHGCRSAVDGSDLGYDGAYRVRNLTTTTLELEAIDGRNPATIGTTNCGGAIIRRTDVRISFVRIFDYERQKVEIQPRPSSDAALAVPVDVKAASSLTVVQSTAASLKAYAQQSTRGDVSLSNGWVFQPDNYVAGDIGSAAITATAESPSITPAFAYGGAASFNVAVTAFSGTTPTLDIGIEESDDTGTNWYRIYDFPRITASGSYRSPVLPLSGNRIRYVRTVGGTSPSFTMSLYRQMHYGVSPKNYRQRYDRTIAIGTVATAGSTLLTNGAKNLMLTGMVSAVGTTSAVVVLQGLVEQTWVEITGASITLSAAGTPISAVVTNLPFEAVRLYVKTAGVGQTLAFLHVKAYD